MDTLFRQIFGDTFRQQLRCEAATLLTLFNEGLGEYIPVSVNNA
jgi:hypothetical protein